MPRIPDPLINCVICLYPSADDADRGTRYGGSGFLIGVPATLPGLEGHHHVYAVSNVHVVRADHEPAPVIRLNAPDGPGHIELTPDNWRPSPWGDDVAVCPLAGDWSSVSAAMISSNMLVTAEALADDGEYGMGNECFMIGRYTNADGSTTGNRPVVRFGNLCRVTTEMINRPDGLAQESLLVEMRSLNGFSGSPVFIYDDGLEFDVGQELQSRGAIMLTIRSPKILGIDWCHLPWPSAVYRGLPVQHGRPYDQVSTDKWAAQNSGMAGVVPAWKIKALLEDDELKDKRNEIEEAEARALRDAPHAVGTPDRESRRPQDRDKFTHDDFIRDLTKVTRREESPEQEA